MTEADLVNKENARAVKQLREAYKKTFSTAHGKLVLADLRLTLPEVVGKLDLNDMYYGMGRRSVMLMIEEKLKETRDGL